MVNRAQAGLEYLMTYGWALIIIATVIGVLVFIIGSPSSSVQFSSSDPAKILLKSGAMQDTVMQAKLQNITGGKITITSATSAEYESIQINQVASPTSLQVPAGSEMTLQATLKTGQTSPKGTITIATQTTQACKEQLKSK